MKNDDDTISLTDDEFHHAVKVMRNKENSKIFITDGKSIIYTCSINKILKDGLSAEIVDRKKYKNKLSNITFCFPVLKNPDRFKFALEKCTELGKRGKIKAPQAPRYTNLKKLLKAKTIPDVFLKN